MSEKIYKNKQEWLEDHPEEKEEWEKMHKRKKRLNIKIDEYTYDRLKEEFGNKIGKGVNTVLRSHVDAIVKPSNEKEAEALRSLRLVIPNGKEDFKLPVEDAITIISEGLHCDADEAYRLLYALIRENFVMRMGDKIHYKRIYKMPTVEGMMLLGGGMFG